MLDHVAKRQAEQRESIRKSFMSDGGAGAAPNGVEFSKKPDVEKSGMEKTMKEFKEGDLKSGSGATVTEKKQAEAIGISEEEKKKVKKSEDNVAPEGDIMKEATEKGGAAGWEVDKDMKEEDEEKDKTKLKDIDLTKSQDNIDFLSSGGFLKAQSQRILGCYGAKVKVKK